MKNANKTYSLILFALFSLFISLASCGAPKEGCGMDPSNDFNKVDYTKKPKKRSNTDLFSKEHRKRMKKRN